MNNDFLSQVQINLLWENTLINKFNRLSQTPNSDLFFGDFKNDLGLDSIEILDLSATFHFMFHMVSGQNIFYLNPHEPIEVWLEKITTAANDFSKPISFETSGSTGTPKIVNHIKEDLIEEAKFWAENFNSVDQVYSMAVPKHIYGFIWGLLVPKFLGVNCTLLQPNQWHSIVNTNKSMIITYPFALELAFSNHIALPSKALYISSTAPISNELWLQITNQNLSLTEIYGSSETGAIGYRNINDKTYLLLPNLTFVNDTLLNKGQREINLPDHIHLEKDGSFKVIGRRDLGVKIAGKLVYTSDISNKMKQLIGIKQVYLRPYQSNNGTRLKAWVLCNEETDREKLQNQIDDFINLQLLPQEKPNHLTISTSKPLDQNGKISDWEIKS